MSFVPFDNLSFAMVGLAIVAVGYVVFGISGFGASLLTVPILSHFYPVPFVLALAVLLDLCGALVVGMRSRRDAEVAEIRWLIPFSVAGAIIGTTLLVNLPRNATILALGAFIAVYGAYGLAVRGPLRRVSGRWAPVAGTFGGITGTLFGIGGPPYLIYLSRRLTDKDRLRATMSHMVAFSLITRLVVFTVAGLMVQPELLTGVILFLPAALAGIAIGTRIHVALRQETLLRILFGVLLASGVSLVVRAAAALR